MSDGRKRLSGYQYKKIAKEKRKKEDELLEKTKRLNTFFRPITPITQDDENNINKPILEGHVQNTTENEICSTSSQGSSTTSEQALYQSQKQEIALSLTTEDVSGLGLGSVSDDPAEWRIINDNLIDHLLSKEINQNLHADFSLSKTRFGNQDRFLSKSAFYRRLPNGENQLRKYLIYSPMKKTLFCVSCRLFGGISQLATEGFRDWSNVNKVLSGHENSKEHLQCQIALIKRSRAKGRVDSGLCTQVKNEIEYWRNVLKRVIVAVKALASRGLPFRGSSERFGSLRNGNFMMTLETIAEFDPFLSTHIAQCGNPGSGKTSYLSSTTCNEFINLIASKVKNTIVREIQAAKYFSIVVDSTPDIAHIDQLSFNIRYVKEDGSPIERFLGFLPNVGHKSEELETAVTSMLASLKIDISNCRGQSYDNASNMSGIYTGLQARLKRLNPLADYVPCAAHSLNLVGACAAECVTEAASFFSTLQSLYTFFAASTRRWDLLSSNGKSSTKVLKRVDGTRWSSRHDACDSLCKNWDGVLQSLMIMIEDVHEKAVTRSEAAVLKKQLGRFETVFMAIFWNSLLDRFNATSKVLQSVDIDVGVAVELYRSLIDFMESLRSDEMFEVYVEKAKCIIPEEYEFDNKRSCKRKLQFGESKENEVIMTGKNKFRVETFYAILDRIRSELEKRHSAYENVFKRFDFIRNLVHLSDSTIHEEATKLYNYYAKDLEDSFAIECVHFRQFLNKTGSKDKLKLIDLCTLIRDQNLLSVFPNIDIALRISLCMAATNCSAERSFSALKRIKTYLRSSLEEERLNSLAILVIEAELMMSLKYDDIIDDFASLKSRRKPLDY
ncbi:zinc finger MYM-type protein 1-like [Temnothorax nylanderi]|uniref:zinc finger MYM-type protein 1-like n=1 Tax=Temnothorax nylanderi TaxID=102681 RepID=UPI003A85579E